MEYRSRDSGYQEGETRIEVGIIIKGEENRESGSVEDIFLRLRDSEISFVGINNQRFTPRRTNYTTKSPFWKSNESNTRWKLIGVFPWKIQPRREYRKDGAKE